jgi:biopolymer transport protein ExbD
VGVESRNATSVLVKKPAAANSDTPLIRAETAQGTTQELTLDELRRHVESQLAAGRPKVVIKADRDVSHGLVQRVVKVVTQVEGVEFAIGVRDAPAGGL